MSILVTCGAGFIVSNLAKTLVSNNYEVIIYDNFWRNYIDLVFKDSSELYQKLKIIKGDILDIKLLKKIIFSNKIEYIFHLAFIASVGKVLANPILTFNTNLIEFLNNKNFLDKLEINFIVKNKIIIKK
ncbi:MAG: GDP-mannose 4,6-dehydratase [bacterium]